MKTFFSTAIAVLVAVSIGSDATAATFPEILGGLRVPSLYAPECLAIPYEPVQAFQSPGGLRIGKLVLDHPELATSSNPSCSSRPQVFFQPEGLNRLIVVHGIEIGYEEPALAVLEKKEAGGETWYRGRAESSTFWLKASSIKNAQFRSYERDLVFGVALASETCDAQGHCLATTQSWQDLVTDAGNETADGCYGNAYGFKEQGARIVELPSGRKAYSVELAPSLRAKYGKSLPAELLVPTYDYRARWTGFYFSRGC